MHRALLLLTTGSLAGLTGVPAMAAPAPGPSTGRVWTTVTTTIAPIHDGHLPSLTLERFRPVVLDHAAMEKALAAAPLESTAPTGAEPLELALPAPDGGFERFAIEESPVMEPGLARRHPEITTYAGRGITDRTATIRISSTPLGFQASIRGQEGPWYIDPYYHLDRSLYASYHARDLQNAHGPLTEPGPILDEEGHEHDHAAASTDDEVSALASTGHVLRTYRLALASDPGYATYFGAANVTAAKVALINRVTQIYEDETSIRMILVANNDRLNFNTAAMATGANGPCGASPCYTSVASCGSSLLTRNRLVIGQLIGASNYDIGHIGLGANGGGIASLGVVGGNAKAQGCTGVVPPTGDFFAVDYVAHEMGHQYAGNHTFNGVDGSCAGNGNPTTSVEPGSGSSIMAYAGICSTDDLQAHSDPYWSQRSFDEITAYVTSNRPALNEVQNAAFSGFDGSDSFTLTYEGNTSAAITNGVNYNAAGISAALAGILPAGATASVSGFWGTGTPSANGFQVTFGGTLAASDVSVLGLNPTGFSGFFGEIVNGGPIQNQGWQITPTGNSAPVVSAPASFTIPYRTPFALTGSGTDPDGDALTFMWEQNNAGAADALLNPAKTRGPLFRQFGVGQDATLYDPQAYNSPGENHPTAADATRVFPDMEQILANNTNAELGICPSATDVDCHSEFLPTSSYVGPMNFRLTARDNHPGGGGVNNASTVVNLAPGVGPFLVLAPNTATTFPGGSSQNVAWNMAGTLAPPVNTANVEILLSTDGGKSFPHVLAASTPNDGLEAVTIPNVGTTEARVMVRAVGNIFFDVSNQDFTIEEQEETADMELVSNTDGADPSFAGETVTYTIEARNNGPFPATNARVVDVLPAGTTYDSSSIPCAESPAGTLTCSLGTLAPGASQSFTVTAAIARDLVHDAGAPVMVTNIATASSDVPDPTPGNDQKSQDTRIEARADLGVVSVEALDPPARLTIGQTASVVLRQTIANQGPSAPMDVRVDRTASSSANGTVNPTATSHEEAALGHLEARTQELAFEIACTDPGTATFTFDVEVSPDRADDSDPDLANNAGQESFSVDCVVPVAINIKPGSSANQINLKSGGSIPVAVLTTLAGEYGLPESFNATAINATTVRFGPESAVLAGGGAPEEHGQTHPEDALERDERTMDGDLDSILHFVIKDAQFTGSETRACVRGTFGPMGFVFHGCDTVKLVK